MACRTEGREQAEQSAGELPESGVRSLWGRLMRGIEDSWRMHDCFIGGGAGEGGHPRQRRAWLEVWDKPEHLGRAGSPADSRSWANVGFRQMMAVTSLSDAVSMCVLNHSVMSGLSDPMWLQPSRL